MYHDIVSNVIVVLFFCGVVIWIDLSLNKKYAHYILGVMFGLITIYIMQDHIVIGGSLFFDFRHIIMTLAGFIGGPITAVIAALISSLYRYNLGGNSSMGGYTSIIVFACFGSILGRHLRSDRNGRKVMFWFTIGIVMASILLFIIDIIPQWINSTVPNFGTVSCLYLIITPFATTIIFTFYFFARKVFSRASILNTIIKRSPINLMIFDAHGPILLSRNIKTELKSYPFIENLLPLLYNDKTWQNTTDLQHQNSGHDPLKKNNCW